MAPTAASVPFPVPVAALRHDLLGWWWEAGRRDPRQKPWMVTAEGRWPEPGEEVGALAVWVAEVMLQQTQLRVVLPYWRRWMEALPDLEALAEADGQTLLRLWQGLGYYSRAGRLREGARRLLARPVAREGGDPWPRTLEGWLELPGIGPSTAGGILSSAFDLPVPLLDGNVRRVLARLLAHPRPPRGEERLFSSWSASLLDPRQPRMFNQALLDLGATVCTPRRPLCLACPWRQACGAYAAGDPTRFPVKELSKPVPFQVIGVGVVQDEGGRVLIDQRLEDGLLGGEAPVFLREGGIQAKAQAPQVASHDRQQQPGVFSWRHGAPSPRGPHRRRHASGSR